MSIINSKGFEQHIYDSMNNPDLIPQYSCTHKTRSLTKQVDEKGATVGCSSMQLYLMIRIALYAHFPKLFESPSTSALFLKIERKIFIIIVHLHRKLFNKDKLEFSDIRDEKVVEYIRRNASQSPQLIQKIESIEHISNQTELNESNMVSIQTLAHCNGLIEESHSHPIPLAFGFKFQERGILAIDHWFILWNGKIHTTWGDDMFGFKYIMSPEISAKTFYEFIQFLQEYSLQPAPPSSSRVDLPPAPPSSSRRKFNFTQFMKEYMGINENTVIVYENYKKIHKRNNGESVETYETRLKTQVVNELIQSYLQPHIVKEFSEDRPKEILTTNRESKLVNASARGYGGFSIYKLQPLQTDYYNVISEIIDELSQNGIIDLSSGGGGGVISEQMERTVSIPAIQYIQARPSEFVTRLEEKCSDEPNVCMQIVNWVMGTKQKTRGGNKKQRTKHIKKRKFTRKNK